MALEGLIAAGITAILALIIVSILIAGIFIWIGAKIAGVEEATFGNAIVAAVGASIVGWIITIVLSGIPVIGTIAGLIIGFIVGGLFVIKSIFSTSWRKAFLTWVFNIVAQVIAVILIVGLMIPAYFVGAQAMWS